MSAWMSEFCKQISTEIDYALRTESLFSLWFWNRHLEST
jgi:hypothetical protein